MVMISASPPDEFQTLVRQMNQVAETLMGRHFYGFSPTDAWRPSVNLYETEHNFLICVDLAGMEQNQIDVQVHGDVVTIRGQRSSPIPPDGVRALAVHLMEIDHGNFCRTVDIPAGVQIDAIEANYHAGMLWIKLPKKT
jgi:HSP20 family protein